MTELKDIKGLEGLYAATRDGRIWSHKRKKFLKLCGVPENYQIVTIKGKSQYVHRLVALAYLENPNNLPCVNHKDEHKHHNWVDNLEWCTAKYNKNYGTHATRKTPVHCIELDKTFESQQAASIELNIHPATLNSCLKGRQSTAGGYHWQYL